MGEREDCAPFPPRSNSSYDQVAPWAFHRRRPEFSHQGRSRWLVGTRFSTTHTSLHCPDFACSSISTRASPLAVDRASSLPAGGRASAFLRHSIPPFGSAP